MTTATLPAPEEPPPRPEFLVGLDLGQSSDFTALAILKRTPGGHAPEDGPPGARLDVVGLRRYDLGTSYPAIVADVLALLERPELRPGPHDRPTLAIDATGVGRAVVDMFAGARTSATIVPITITAGDAITGDTWPGLGPCYRVAKKHLVGAVQMGLQTGTLLVVPSLAHAELLKRELLDFKIKVTEAANETFLAREGAHDDLVLAVACACWLSGERGPVFGLEHATAVPRPDRRGFDGLVDRMRAHAADRPPFWNRAR